ncbi:MAG: hypothetical protein LKK19_05190 [Bacteroidales bacterium]|jgi:lipopolysaccharide biosynthesis glycosyltransferase|nr:hypothetical protein [Bacteroidales bacterium]MCI2122078.1 hypothetical protein [Bacteroidales bacterium]MCI2146317.1 hypothetical protein [Bacteroidales bacterium]
MNILYCGDSKTEDGVLISVLSLVGNVKEPLHVYVMTMAIRVGNKSFSPISSGFIGFLDGLVKRACPESFVVSSDLTGLFGSDLPAANLKTRFTPYCMLRLFADEMDGLPDRLMYLDNDVVCRLDCSGFYHQDIENYEFAGVLDYYGQWFYSRNILHRDYVNSGVLLMNMKKMRETGLLTKCRLSCRKVRMFLPDQHALNRHAVAKKIDGRKYNEQRKLHEDTVLQHFTTSFRLWPWLHAISVKPWQVDRMHDLLKIHEYDNLLIEYQTIKETASL